MKKWICILLTLVVAALAGCAASDAVPATEPVTEAATEPAPTEPETQPATRDVNAAYEVEVREIWCENNGNRIYGEAYIPVADGKFPLVICSHGMGTNHKAGAGYARNYAEKGFAAYTFDFPGGSNRDNENLSDGDPLEMSVLTEASDLEAILSTALTWDFVDTAYVFLQGGSQGGLVSTIVGLDHQDEIAGMILLYPALTMPQGMHRYFDSYDDIPETVSFTSNYTLGAKFVQDLWDLDVMSQLSDFDKNVLIIHGSEDSIVPVSVSEEAVTLFPHAELKVLEGAEHGFSGEYFTQASQYAIEFLFANT